MVCLCAVCMYDINAAVWLQIMFSLGDSGLLLRIRLCPVMPKNTSFSVI